LAKTRPMQVVAARLPKDVVREIERIAAEEELDKSSVVARATDLFIRHWKLEKALKLYEDGRITAQKAADVAALSIWEFIEELERRKIPAQYSAGEFLEDFEAAQKG
jgi:predicted HTH domain antitoxin